MPYQPPFSITSEILNLVAEISQQVGRLDASALNASPQLRKQNHIKTITGTLAIEGNTLTEEQSTAIVEGKPVLGSVRELAAITQTLAQNAPVNATVNAPANQAVDVRGRKTPDAIVALLSANPLLTRQQLADTIGKDLRTIGRAIAQLQQAGRLKRVGSDKSGHWETLG